MAHLRLKYSLRRPGLSIYWVLVADVERAKRYYRSRRQRERW
jgi:hypothetical protein